MNRADQPLSWCRLPQFGVLRFAGADARAFLHSQLTCDVQNLRVARSSYGGYCTPKGRLLASFLLWQQPQPEQHGEAFYLLLPSALCEPLRKRLSMFILRSKVKAEDIGDAYRCYGVGSDSTIEKITGAAPTAVHEAMSSEGIGVIKLPVHRWLIVAPLSKSEEIEAALAQSGAEQDAARWDLLDIQAGVPFIVPATQEEFVPQMVNFDLIGAVSFDKGCYPGQEIVARTHYLGKLKQRMVHAQVSATANVVAGDKLYSAALGDQAAGMIVSASPAAGGHELLAVVQQSAISNDGTAIDAHWKSPDGAALSMRPLPYTLK